MVSLLTSAVQSWWCFARPLSIILATPLVRRRCLPLLNRWCLSSAILPQGQVLYRQIQVSKALVGLLTLYGVYYTVVRPPSILITSDMLLDGFATAGNMAWQTILPPSINKKTKIRDTLYGRSNALEPRLSVLKPIRHGFCINGECGESRLASVISLLRGTQLHEYANRVQNT